MNEQLEVSIRVARIVWEGDGVTLNEKRGRDDRGIVVSGQLYKLDVVGSRDTKSCSVNRCYDQIVGTLCSEMDNPVASHHRI